MNFLLKCLHWGIGFVKWSRIMLRSWFTTHFDFIDSKYRSKLAKKNFGLDKIVYYKKIQGVSEYCQNNSISCFLFPKQDTIHVYDPTAFEGKSESSYTFPCPDIYMTELNNVHMFGESEIIIANDTILSDAFMYNQTEKRHIFNGGSLIKHKEDRYSMVAYKDSDTYIENAISLLGWVPSNYFHFTLEIMPKLALIDKLEQYRSWPILVDQCVWDVPQLHALLDRLNIYHHKVILVKNRTKVTIGKLVYVSYTMWLAHNFKEGAEIKPSDFLLSDYVVNNIRETVISNISYDPSKHRKIFLSRKNMSKSRLVNSAEIEHIFQENGYEIVCPEDLSFEEEVRLFREADVVVGPTGAAFTNMIYCRPNTRINVIALESQHIYYYPTLAHMAGVNFELLGAKLVQKGSAEYQDTFSLDISKCQRFIAQTEQLLMRTLYT